MRITCKPFVNFTGISCLIAFVGVAITHGEAVKKLGQAPRSYAKSLQNTDLHSEPVPFFHSLGADESPKPTTEVDERLLDGLDNLEPTRPKPAADIAGEDLGAAKPQSTLAGLARLMQGVEQRMRRDDTSPATQRLQSDIAAELAKLLETAEQENANRSSAAPADTPVDQTSKTGSDGTEGDPQSRTGDGTNEQSDLLDAVWGTLPERLRQQIQSPLQEEFLPRYERVIKQYYKRLAEEQQRLRD